ncbi:MAG: histidine kinase [Lachnospiraceae bacterium]|nr:histidine kinase [Lachnospiraceae bacterium]
MIEKIKNINLRTRVLIQMAVLIILIITVFSLIFISRYYKYENEILGQERIQNLYSLSASLDGLFSNADNCSKMMIADYTVQEQMAGGDLNSSTLGQQMVINKAYSILQFSEGIESIWLIDGRGQKLLIGNTAGMSKNDDKDSFEELKKPYGSAEMYIERGSNNSSFALVRAYNNTVDFTPAGIIGVDISGEYINSLILKIVDIENEYLLILDDADNIIYWNGPEESAGEYKSPAEDLFGDETEVFKRLKVSGNTFNMSGINDPEKGWRIIRFTPSFIDTPESTGLKQLVLCLIVIIGALIFITSSFVAGSLTRPIQQMYSAMNETKDGIPQRIEDKAKIHEFQILFSGYNQMVERIRQLIDETIQRQKRIRQVELNEIQEQMKPHFLYNTLDSIEALAMMGDTENVCRLIESLGDFYRRSVSGGREFLTVAEEIRMARDYSQIMHIRFGETFTCEIECDEGCNSYQIPKLTIQPLIENAFQHGIRGRMEYGHISLNVKELEESIQIRINDNGAGIPREVIDELSENKEIGGKGSLGLRGTIKRLSLIYGEDFSYSIGKGSPSEIELFINKGALNEQAEANNS